jgi:hypothetical protein
LLNDLENTEETISKDLFPETRIKPIAPIPFAVAMAQIVSFVLLMVLTLLVLS